MESPAKAADPSQTPDSSQPPLNRSLTQDQITQIQKVLATPNDLADKPNKPPSSFWTIFWTYSLPPLGWFMMRRISWPLWVKSLLVVSSIALYVWAAIETEVIASQITSQLSSIDSGLLP